MKYEIQLFFTALQFYTRLPVPMWVGYSETALNQATRYLPLIGWLVGFLAGLTWIVGTYLVDASTGLLISMIVSVLLTGAFHEDGFADVCDGFGGGWTKEKILEIMKDSRIGTYGMVGLVLLLGLKFGLLLHVASSLLNRPLVLLLLLMSAHATSRFMAASFIFTHPYARDSVDSKAKPVAQAGSITTLLIAGLVAFIPLISFAFVVDKPLLLMSILLMYGLKIYLGRYFTKWIGGYTGDCLGATQQVCEVSFYLFVAILWKFT